MAEAESLRSLFNFAVNYPSFLLLHNSCHSSAVSVWLPSIVWTFGATSPLFLLRRHHIRYFSSLICSIFFLMYLLFDKHLESCLFIRHRDLTFHMQLFRRQITLLLVYIGVLTNLKESWSPSLILKSILKNPEGALHMCYFYTSCFHYFGKTLYASHYLCLTIFNWC